MPDANRWKVTGEIIFYINGTKLSAQRYQDVRGKIGSREEILERWLSFYTINCNDVVSYGIIPDEIRDWQPKHIPV